MDWHMLAYLAPSDILKMKAQPRTLTFVVQMLSLAAE